MSAIRRLFGIRLSKHDRELISKYLDEPGKFLFYQMSLPDQRHSIAVAKEILAAAGFQKEVDLTILMQSALLHDIGKVSGEFNLVNRIVAGIVSRISPGLLAKCGDPERRGLLRIRYGFYVETVHPSRGAHMAKIFGINPKVVELIAKHHDPPTESNSLELDWLQYADNKH